MSQFYQKLALWLVFGLILVFMWSYFSKTGQAAQEILYSDFLEQVEQGHIHAVRIRGEKITGNNGTQRKKKTATRGGRSSTRNKQAAVPGAKPAARGHKPAPRGSKPATRGKTAATRAGKPTTRGTKAASGRKRTS